jgi:hypothetical protein
MTFLEHVMTTHALDPHFSNSPTQTIAVPILLNKNAFSLFLFGAMIFFGSIVIIEPSPYDLLAFAAIPFFALTGFKIKRGLLFFILIMTIYEIGGFTSLIQHFHQSDAVVFQLLSFYLYITSLFFAFFFSEDTVKRLNYCLKAYAAGACVAAICGIMGYFNIAGTFDIFTLYGRAAGTFKDPNVFGSYLVLAIVFLMQRILLGYTTRPFIWGTVLLTLIIGVLLSFSRGSWGATIFASGVMVVLSYLTAESPAMRRRVVISSILAVAAVITALMILLSFENMREFFVQRASITQDYDSGETGRFGNQLRSITMLLDRPLGFGPLLFRKWFGMEPHNSYINAFASCGWLGGFAFIVLVIATFFVGFRLCIRPSPFRRISQVVWPALMVLLLQGFQIDIDHWRFVFLLFGMVWGLEAARQEWELND